MEYNNNLPNLATILPLNKIPPELEFIEDSIQKVFSKIKVKDYSHSQNADGSARHYFANLWLDETFSLKLLNTGIELVVNAGEVSGTELPFKLNF